MALYDIPGAAPRAFVHIIIGLRGILKVQPCDPLEFFICSIYVSRRLALDMDELPQNALHVCCVLDQSFPN